MPSSQKIDLQRDFAAGVNLSETQNLIPPFLHTVYVYTVQYTYSHREAGRGGRVEPKRRGRGATVQKAGSKIAT
jgi:hypothetical protein